jgi:DNA-binding transcriptional regulator GbsR (MarR family)
MDLQKLKKLFTQSSADGIADLPAVRQGFADKSYYSSPFCEPLRNTLRASARKKSYNMDAKEIKIRECIEKFGVYYKKTGHQPMVGRLMAFLMLAEPPHKTFEEIVEFLVSSKSAVSNTLNMLMYMGIVDYVKITGDRKRYFRLNQNSWNTMFDAQIQELSHLRDLVGEVLDLRSEQFPELNRDISDFHSLLEIYEQEFPVILNEWKQQIKNRKT